VRLFNGSVLRRGGCNPGSVDGFVLLSEVTSQIEDSQSTGHRGVDREFDRRWTGGLTGRWTGDYGRLKQIVSCGQRERLASVRGPNIFSALTQTATSSVAGSNRGPATTEIDSPSLRGRRRLNRRVNLILSQESFH
jgi:hypothetical protein